MDISEVILEAQEDNSQEWVKVFVLFGLAIYFTYNIVSGNLTNYINERFVWLSYIAVVIFALLGAATLVGLINKNFTYEGHQKITWGIILVVAMPLILGTLIPSRPLGAEAVNGDISLSVASAANTNTLAKDPLSRNVLDWLRLFNETPVAADFNGQEADIIGFIYRQDDFPEDHFMVARFTVSCCVADAGAIGLPVYAPDAAALSDGEWVRVQGTFDSGFFRDSKMPILQATALEVVEQPEHPYLYP